MPKKQHKRSIKPRLRRSPRKVRPRQGKSPMWLRAIAFALVCITCAGPSARSAKPLGAMDPSCSEPPETDDLKLELCRGDADAVCCRYNFKGCAVYVCRVGCHGDWSVAGADEDCTPIEKTEVLLERNALPLAG